MPTVWLGCNDWMPSAAQRRHVIFASVWFLSTGSNRVHIFSMDFYWWHRGLGARRNSHQERCSLIKSRPTEVPSRRSAPEGFECPKKWEVSVYHVYPLFGLQFSIAHCLHIFWYHLVNHRLGLASVTQRSYSRVCSSGSYSVLQFLV